MRRERGLIDGKKRLLRLVGMYTESSYGTPKNDLGAETSGKTTTGN